MCGYQTLICIPEIRNCRFSEIFVLLLDVAKSNLIKLTPYLFIIRVRLSETKETISHLRKQTVEGRVTTAEATLLLLEVSSFMNDGYAESRSSVQISVQFQI